MPEAGPACVDCWASSPANYLGARPARPPRGHPSILLSVRLSVRPCALTQPEVGVITSHPTPSPLPAHCRHPRPRPPAPPATSHGPACSLAGRGGARAPAPLKSESGSQQVRNLEIPDPPLWLRVCSRKRRGERSKAEERERAGRSVGGGPGARATLYRVWLFRG